VAEGAGLENRYTRKGIVGSNPTLSVYRLPFGMSFLLAQAFAPGDCILTGLCGVQQAATRVPSGLLFVALGLVLYGASGLLRSRLGSGRSTRPC